MPNRVGDIDVAIQLAPRERNFRKHMEANARRVAEEREKGRRFSNMIDEIYWWRREAMLFLRNHKRGLSLHDYASNRQIVESAQNRALELKRPVRRRSAGN